MLAFLKTAPEELQKEVKAHQQTITLPKGHTICWQGDTCNHLAFVISGNAKVYKLSESGKEITLYRVEKNESCILTVSCILSEQDFPAIAVTESAVEAILLPAGKVREWVGKHSVWREYIFGMMSRRFSEVIETVEEVAFKRVDIRICEFLSTRFKQSSEIKVTHSEIASELGTAREVVSRILKDFEREGLVQLSRGSITLSNEEQFQLKINRECVI